MHILVHRFYRKSSRNAVRPQWSYKLFLAKYEHEMLWTDFWKIQHDDCSSLQHFQSSHKWKPKLCAQLVQSSSYINRYSKRHYKPSTAISQMICFTTCSTNGELGVYVLPWSRCIPSKNSKAPLNQIGRWKKKRCFENLTTFLMKHTTFEDKFWCQHRFVHLDIFHL